MIRATLACVLLLASAPVFATSFAGTTAGAGSSASSKAGGASSNSSSGNSKVVKHARDDAASFVASEGGVRGVRLESAFEFIRQQAPQLQATDAQLAQAILTI